LTLESSAEWHFLLESKPWTGKDTYFLPAWYQTWEKGGYGRAHCLQVNIGDVFFIYPFLLHAIEGYDTGERYYDVETAYGYGGVLTSGYPSAGQTAEFNTLVDRWMLDNRVVAEFIRLHPDLNNMKLREATYTPARQDVFLDLQNKTKESIWDGILSAKTRNMIRKAEKNNMEISIHKNLKKSFNDFTRVYLESARRLNYERFYWFTDMYYKAFQECMSDLAFQVNVTQDKEVIAASIWLDYGDTWHYYLAATADEYTHLPCSDLSIWKTICTALESGVPHRLHLGGGTSIDPEDALFKFKAKFSDRSEMVHIGRRVHNEPIYKILCDQWAQKYPQLVSLHRHKLLRYRETGVPIST
jgi:hypothetical protein